MEKKNQDLKPKSLLAFNPLTPTPPIAKPQLPIFLRSEEWGFSVEPSFLYLRFPLFFECETQSFNFCSSCVRCATNAQRTNKSQNRIRFVVPQLCNERSTNIRGKFSFSSFVPCFTLKLVLCFSWKLHVFLSLLHLSTSSYKRERGLMSFKNNLQTHITPNFTQMHIFQLVLFPICICIILNHLSPKIMYIQRKLR